MKKYKVIFSDEAEAEFREIYRYLAVEKESGFAAKNLIQKIKQDILSLEIFPNGFSVYEPHPEYRVIHVKKYKIFYRVHEGLETVVIEHIVHSLKDF